MKKENYRPYIPADKRLPEFTPLAVILGSVMAVVFGGANAYLGLRVGMTVSASIPAAVVSMGIIRLVLKRDSILENNLVQTIGSAGEAVAGGAVFTLPVLFMWAGEGQITMPSVAELSLVCLCGGVLGVAFMIPLREMLIVQEHGRLPYPEGTACAEVLVAGEEGGGKAAVVFRGLGISAVYKFISDGLQVFPSQVDYEIPAYPGSGIGADILPALAGVGYICGAKVSSYMFCGGLLAWFVLMPLIAMFGSELTIYPAMMSVASLVEKEGAWGIWSNYIRYVGAGAVVGGGIISMVRTVPMLVQTLRAAPGKPEKGGGAVQLRTHESLSPRATGCLILAVVLLLVLAPSVPVNLFGVMIIVAFGFVFAAVTSRIVGLVGSNNSPVSGMTIATLMLTCLLFRMIGYSGMPAMTAAIVITGVICTIVAASGDTSQDLKSGYLVGATPKYQQIGEIIGCAVTSLAIGGILYLLNLSWGYGSAELPAPQATLMRMVVEGVMGGDLPWTLIVSGIFIAVMIEILGVPVLPFAIGLYLPFHLSVGIMCGGVVRLIVDKIRYASEEQHREAVESGVLYTSGMIAGEGVVGIILAVCAVIPLGAGTVTDRIRLPEGLQIGQTGGVICFVLLLLSILRVAIGKRRLTR